MRVVALIALLASAATLAIDRFGGAGGNYSLDEAREFGDFPLYYAGDEVEGLPLTAVLRRDDSAEYVSFVYGDCTPSSDGGCAPPAEVQVWPGAVRNLGSYDASAPGRPIPEQTRIRGRPAAVFEDGARIEVYADGATIVVFAHTTELARAIAESLRCVREGLVGSHGRLDC